MQTAAAGNHPLRFAVVQKPPKNILASRQTATQPDDQAVARPAPESGLHSGCATSPARQQSCADDGVEARHPCLPPDSRAPPAAHTRLAAVANTGECGPADRNPASHRLPVAANVATRS